MSTPETDDLSASWSFETKQIHAGQTPDPATHARALPIYQTTSYTFDNTEHAAALFGLAEPGNIYTRIMNPTQDTVEQRIAALEGGVAALFLASGQAAETFAILNIAGAGDHIVSSPRLYGGTYNLLHYTLPKLGIETTFVEDPDDLDSWQQGGPAEHQGVLRRDHLQPADRHPRHPRGRRGRPRQRRATDRRQHHRDAVPDPADRPGADIVVHSATKYLGGHGTAIAGVIVDSGNFDWTNGKFPGFTTPDPSYHGVVFAELGAAGVRPQGPGATAARPRFGGLAVQRVPGRPGAGDAEPADRTPRRQRPGGRRVPRRPRRRGVGQLRGAAQLAVARAGKEAGAQGNRRGAVLRVGRRRRGGQGVRRTRSSCTATWPTSATCARW